MGEQGRKEGQEIPVTWSMLPWSSGYCQPNKLKMLDDDRVCKNKIKQIVSKYCFYLPLITYIEIH